MNSLRTFLAALLGFVLGATLYFPTKASVGVTLKEGRPGYNSAIGSDDVIVFSCARDACYVLSR